MGLVHELKWGSLLNTAGPNIPIFRRHEVDAFLADVHDYYTEWVNVIMGLYEGEFGVKVPVLVHGYAHPVPNGRGFRLRGVTVEGPWFEQSFEAKGHTDLQKNTDELAGLVDRFNRVLSTFSGSSAEVYYVDARCLSRNLRDYRHDWADEIHPTPSGFEKVAKEFSQELAKLGIQPSPQVSPLQAPVTTSTGMKHTSVRPASGSLVKIVCGNPIQGGILYELAKAGSIGSGCKACAQ